MLDPGKITAPLNQVTVSPSFPATFRNGIERIATIRRTMKHFLVLGVPVEWAVGLPLGPTIGAGKTTSVRHRWSLPSKSSPAIVIRIAIPVVLSVHLEGETDLALVTEALSLKRFGF